MRARRRDHRRLRRAGWLRRGYARRQVDELLAHVERRLSAGDPVAAADVRRAGFDLVRHGYEIGAVDRLLDRLERRCVEQAFAGEPLWALEDELRSDAVRLREELSGPPGMRFARLGRLHRGYAPADVDALVERVLRALDPFAATPDGDQVQADDVRFTVFSRVRGGYAETGVDDVMDRVVDLLLRHAVLRAQIAAAEVVQALGPEAFAQPSYLDEAPPSYSEPDPPLSAAGGAG
ncbi:hypothetical protein [Motilibacter deserti]|uniref:DivIVA domain-containing protein n=1 Tax=Motilibacter deserti TaxID=2714956 RepID=A0ABX0GV28_9ACTN|nr:hypothetical protein [Motilibacter deserti]NHC13561.1 hypothetical protein [Motilibacter deserti]